MNTQTIGARIRAKRKEFGLTQFGLASACGWGSDNGGFRISKYERDEREPGYSELRVMARVMRCSVDELGAGETAGVRVQDIALDDLRPDPEQPRRVDLTDNDQAASIRQLADSIAEHGVLQPITVRPAADGAGYTVIYGERRCRAAVEAHLRTIPAIVRTDIADDTDRLAIQILENLQRVDLTLPELITGIGKLAQSRTHDQIAAELGRSRTWVSRRASLHDCRVELWHPIASGAINDIDLAHAYKQLLEVDHETAQRILASVSEGHHHPRDSIQEVLRAARARAEKRQAEAGAEREPAEPQRREQQPADNYDGPLDETAGAPSAVTGREGTLAAERETAPADTTAADERQQAARRLEQQLTIHLDYIAGGASTRFDAIDGAWHIALSLNKRAEAESLVGHILRWHPPATNGDPP